MCHDRRAYLGPARAAVVRSAALVAAAALLACDRSPVDWSARRVTRAGPVITVDAMGTPRPDTLALLATRIPRPAGEICPYSFVVSRVPGRVYAAWWRVRPDSSVTLLESHTGDEGRTWSAPAAVDTTDQGVTGCQRTPPAVAADPRSGYVHIAYALQAREGPGLFYAHSMDSGATFHSAVPIFYGERLGRTAVAADGDVVAVAFEDPNGRTPRLGLALSHTMGHIFEHRLLPVSDDNGVATHPRVAVSGRHIAIAWDRRAAADSPAVVLAIRSGVLR